MLTSPPLPGSSSHKLQEGLGAVVTCPASSSRVAPTGEGEAGLDRTEGALGGSLWHSSQHLGPKGTREFLHCPFLESGVMRYCWALCEPPEAHQQHPAPSPRGSPMPGPGLRSAGAAPAQVRSHRAQRQVTQCGSSRVGPES